MAPLSALGASLKRKTTDLNVRVQQASPLVSRGSDRLGQVATVSVTAATLAAGGILPAGALSSGSEDVAAAAVEVEGDEAGATAELPDTLASGSTTHGRSSEGRSQTPGDQEAQEVSHDSVAGTTDPTPGLCPRSRGRRVPRH